MNNKIIARKLNKIAKELLSVDFPNQKAMNDYLKQHPKADRKNHKVVEFKPKQNAKTEWETKGTNSEYFKDWFGGSKVVDKKGNPLICYHGSPDLKDIKENGIFKTTNEKLFGNDKNQTYFFTDNYSVANSYADPYRAFDIQTAEEGVESTYIALKNPLVIDGKKQQWNKLRTTINETELVGTKSITKHAMENGYDGLIINNVKDSYNNDYRSPIGNVYIAFNSNQIKSANGNNGDFSKTDNNIYK